jgi:uncharacterized protein YjiS (DUF1127 family)
MRLIGLVSAAISLVWRTTMKIGCAVIHWRISSAERRELAGLTDRDLRDAGLSRYDIAARGRKPGREGGGVK